MSDESAKDVSPLRLRRPVPSAPPPGAGIPPSSAPPLPFAKLLPSEAPLDAPVGPVTAPAASLPLRRRPSLTAEAGHAAGAAESNPLAPLLDPAPPSEHEVLTPMKLRVGPKPAPLPPPDVGANLPDNLFPEMEGTPLMPLSGLAPLPGAAPMGTGAMPPPLPGSTLGGESAGVSHSPYKLVGIDLASSSSAGKTRPPLPVSAGEAKRKVGKATAALRDLQIFLVIFLCIGSFGAGAYFFFKKPAASGVAVSSVKETIAKVAEMPGKAVENAKGGIAGARGTEQSRIDNMAEGKEPQENRGLGVLSPSDVAAKLQEENGKAVKEAPSAAHNKVIPVVVSAGEAAGRPGSGKAPPPPSAASTRFVKFAEALNINGVYQGTPARALIDGRLIREGEVIEANLGISFVGVDTGTKHLILQDSSGTQLRIKY